MQHGFIIITILFFITVINSCKKDTNSNAHCSPDALTSREITNERATIKKLGSGFYIIEQGSIDTKLIPCNLEAEFQVGDLEVTVSGDAKTTLPENTCCTEYFLITKISR
ncbi:MAG: hypothetical protein ABI863_07530 [Ginsengibacter sp.]